VVPTLNESIVEDAALEWFRELNYAVGHGPHLAPGEYAEGTLSPALSQGERESCSEVVLVGRLREAMRRPAAAGPAIPDGGVCNRQGILVSSKPIERRRNP
jgi:type I restriction enzyme, R subunit